VEGEGVTVKRMVDVPQRGEEEAVSEEAGTTDVARREVATPQPRRQVRVSGSIMKSVIFSAAESPFLAMGIVQLEIRRI